MTAIKDGERFTDLKHYLGKGKPVLDVKAVT
jgi:hypothetical protein